MQVFFHRERRRLIAQTFFDIFKYVVIGGCLSGFFKDLDPMVKSVIAVLALASLIIGFAFSPAPEEVSNG